MKMLNLTIDLPKSAYTITDAPTTVQRIINTLAAIFAAIISLLSDIGEGIIYAVLALGRGVEFLIDTVDVLLVKIESLPYIIGKAFISLFIERTVNYVA